MLVVIGSYQISVQRREFNAQRQAQQEVRRLQLERQVEAERRQAQLQYQEFSAGLR